MSKQLNHELYRNSSFLDNEYFDFLIPPKHLSCREYRFLSIPASYESRQCGNILLLRSLCDQEFCFVVWRKLVTGVLDLEILRLRVKLVNVMFLSPDVRLTTSLTLLVCGTGVFFCGACDRAWMVGFWQCLPRV